MDPYIEQRWGDFHTRLMTELANALHPLLPGELRARIEERIVLESIDASSPSYRPDIHVYETPRPGSAASDADIPALAVAEPLVMQISQEVTERFIQIIDVKSGGKVVTVIEVLSPSNKDQGREEYLEKQQDVRDGLVNLVEIDLVHGGQATTLSRLAPIPSDKRATYHTSIFRAARPDRIAYFRMPLRERLPRVPIPLRPEDADAVIDLQSLVDRIYELSGYDDLDYTRTVSPPLPPGDNEWAQDLIHAARR
jgi:hypothetical protein